MKIGIITNALKDKNLIYTNIITKHVLNNGGTPLITLIGQSDIVLDDIFLSTEEEIIKKSDIIICMGGDGTFLHISKEASKYNKPILGVNLGSLGFLAEVDKDDLENTVINLFKNNYVIDERIMLDIQIFRDNKLIGSDIALNDAVISRGALSRILHLDVSINDTYIDNFPGDGLIISSPTGSTGYSMSAGGPIVEPDIDIIIVTPICPHNLYSRSFITTGEKSIKISIEENYCHSAILTVDGQKGYELCGSDIIKIKKSFEKVKIIRLHQINFFNVLRTKIYNRKESVRKNEI